MKIPSSQDEIKRINDTVTALFKNMKENCILIFAHNDFKGNSTQVCQNTTNLNFTDFGSSLISGIKANGILFEKENYQGRILPFGHNIAYPDFNFYDYEDLNKNISSVVFNTENCAVMLYKLKENPNNYFNKLFCQNNTQADVNFENDLSYITFYVFKDDIKVSLFSENEYKGISHEIVATRNLDIKTWKLGSSIKSVKIEKI